MRFPCATSVAIGLLGFLLATTARSADDASVDAKTAFSRLKGLAGEWSVQPKDGQPASKFIYQVTSNGSAVVERLHAGTDHEMITMYHLDGDDLTLTHYCVLANQPRMKLDKKSSKPDHLEFVFVGGTNLDPKTDHHMHAQRYTFRDKDHFEAEWDGYQDGAKNHTHKVELTRK
jgi:hypothetical protein